MRRGALVLVVLVAAGSCGGMVIEERDGEGALFSTMGTHWGVWMGPPASVDVGSTWSFGSVRLCLTAPGERPVVWSLEPAEIKGQVRVEPIRIRMAMRPPPTGEQRPEGYEGLPTIIGARRGEPRELHDPEGWVVPTGCHWRRPVSEVVVTMTKTGPEGGGINGIVVTYSWDGRLHRFTIPVTFGICGPPETDLWDLDLCWWPEELPDRHDPPRNAQRARLRDVALDRRAGIEIEVQPSRAGS